MKRLRRFLLRENDRDLVEYTLMLAVVLGSTGLFINSTNSVQTIWGAARTVLSEGATGGIQGGNIGLAADCTGG